MEMQKQMVISQVRKELRERIEWVFKIAMKNPENRLLDAYFRGEDLGGFLQHVYARRSDLWKSFAKTCHFNPESSCVIFTQFRPFFSR